MYGIREQEVVYTRTEHNEVQQTLSDMYVDAGCVGYIILTTKFSSCNNRNNIQIRLC